MSGDSREALARRAPPALLIAAVVIFFWKACVFSGALFFFDLAELTIPARDFFFKQVARGRFPLWSPFMCGGAPLFDQGHAGSWYPPNYFLFTWLPAWRALNVSAVLHALAAALGAYLWLGRSHSRPAAAVGAVIYAFGSPLIFHLVHFMFFEVFCLFPWLFFCFDRYLEKGRLADVLAASAILGAMFAAGHQQAGLLAAIALAIFCLALAAETAASRRPRAAAKIVAALLGVGVLAALMSTGAAVGMRRLLPESIRSDRLPPSFLYLFSLVPDAFARLASPAQHGRNLDGTWLLDGVPEKEVGVYLGLAVWCFLPLLFAGPWRRRDRAHLAVVAFGLLFALGSAGPFTGLVDRLPLLDRLRIPTRFFLPMSLSFAHLAASGLDRLRDDRISSRRLLIGLLAGALAWAATARWGEFAAFGRGAPRAMARDAFLAAASALRRDLLWRTALAAGLVIAALLLRRARGARPAYRAAAWLAIGALVFADLASANREENPVADPAIFSPRRTVEFLRPRLHGFRFITRQALGAVAHGNWTRDLNANFAGAEGLPYALGGMSGLRTMNCDSPLNLRRLKQAADRLDVSLLRQMSVKYVLSTDRAAADLPRAGAAGAWNIFEVPDPLPIYGFAAAIRRVGGEAEALEAWLNSTGEDAPAIVEDAADLPAVEPSPAAASIVAEEPDRRRLRVDADRPAFLIVRENYYPGWQATIDGAPVKTYRVNYLYWGFAVPAGAHEITLAFRPAGFGPALAVSLLTFVGALGLALFYPPFRRTRPAFADAPADRRIGRWALGAILVLFFALLVVAAARHPALWDFSHVLSPRWR